MQTRARTYTAQENAVRYHLPLFPELYFHVPRKHWWKVVPSGNPVVAIWFEAELEKGGWVGKFACRAQK